MASKRRNIFDQNKKQVTTEIVVSSSQPLKMRRFAALLLTVTLWWGALSQEELPEGIGEDEVCECVPYFQCDLDRRFKTDGSDLLDPRDYSTRRSQGRRLLCRRSGFKERVEEDREDTRGFGVSFKFGVEGFEYFVKDLSDCGDFEIGMKSVV
ncbi:hypothetical protein AAG570_005530 [Ranatra chinensis]|uniref:PPAF-2-like Clip domain-containing protein n=1 Tax=Ranatra chinensis TaxID=642074 RepID=A0ABD0Y097_9HEMI